MYKNGCVTKVLYEVYVIHICIYDIFLIVNSLYVIGKTKGNTKLLYKKSGTIHTNSK